MICGGLKIAYDLLLLGMFSKVRPPESSAADGDGGTVNPVASPPPHHAVELLLDRDDARGPRIAQQGDIGKRAGDTMAPSERCHQSASLSHGHLHELVAALQ
ncbi:MAG: hypothetical protein KIT18_07355 [Burkholderiales bacterium]|nr:hypothetical protein [Burkholderiales bacterium]